MPLRGPQGSTLSPPPADRRVENPVKRDPFDSLRSLRAVSEVRLRRAESNGC